MYKKLRGYFPIVPSAYTETGEIDLASMRRLTTYLIESGAQGMSPNGGDSEAAHLTTEERMQVADAIIETNAGRTPVLIGTTAKNTEESVQLVQHAQKAGADAVFTQPGWGLKDLSAEQISAYYAALCDASDIPIMIHGTHDMDAALIGQLIDKFPQIEYVKEETSHGPKLRQYVKEFGDRITIFGPGLHYPAELEWGALGVMPSCCAPHAHARVFDLWQEGHHAESRREWNRMLPLVFWRWHTAAGEAGKHYLKHLGIFTTPYVRQQVALPGQHDGAQASFGNLRLDEVDIQEMLNILATMGEPPY